MRKVIALLLTVLMLASVLAVMPASAAAATYDGTTKDTVNKILITEIGRNISYTRNPSVETANSMNFVEIYNNSDAAIELDTLSLLLAVEIPQVPQDNANRYLAFKNEDEERPLWKEWRDHYRFLSEMEINSGAIVSESDASLADISASMRNNYLKNEDVSVEPGKTAVIWLITSQTIEWLKKAPEQIGSFDPKTEFLRNYYGNQVDPSQYTVVMVWAYSDYTLEDSSILADDMFNFEFAPATFSTSEESYVVGVANKSWVVDTDVAYDKTEATVNENLYAMTVLGHTVDKYSNTAETSIIAAPANAKPFVQNAFQKFIGSTTEYTDFFNAGLVKSYRESGVISFACATPTPGSVPEWHQLMIDAAKRDLAEAELTKISDHVKETYNYVDDGTNAGRDESGIGRDYNFESQEDIKNRFNNTKKKDTVTDDDNGLSTVVLIIIIVAAVVVVGGACAVVFLVVLPKKKKAAAAAAEAPVEEAPAEEAPAEEAPAEENKDE